MMREFSEDGEEPREFDHENHGSWEPGYELYAPAIRALGEVGSDDDAEEEEILEPGEHAYLNLGREFNRETPPVALLARVLPDLENVREAYMILREPGERASHDDAAYKLIQSLQIGFEALHLLTPRLTFEAPDPEQGLADRTFLFGVGIVLETALLRHGLRWPQTYPPPPPAVVRDLVDIYDYAAALSPQAKTGIEDRFLEHVQRISIRLGGLLGAWGADSLDVARELNQPARESLRSRAEMIVGGVAIVISLLQGPGALHNFPQDARNLGGDVAKVASWAASGVEGAVRELGDVLDRLGHY